MKDHNCENKPVSVTFYCVTNWPKPFWEMWIDGKIHFDVIGCPFCLKRLEVENGGVKESKEAGAD